MWNEQFSPRTIKKREYLEYSRFCWKIWCWGNNLTSKRKKGTKRNYKPKANDKGKENNAVSWNLAEFNKIPACRAAHVLHVHHVFLYIFLPLPHEYGGKMPNFTFYGGRKQATTKTLFTWSGGPRSGGVSFFCFVSPRAWKQKKLTPLDRGPPLHVNRPLIFFLFLKLNMVLRNSAQKGFACIWQSKWVGLIAIEIERTQIHFLSDVFVAVGVVIS